MVRTTYTVGTFNMRHRDALVNDSPTGRSETAPDLGASNRLADVDHPPVPCHLATKGTTRHTSHVSYTLYDLYTLRAL